MLTIFTICKPFIGHSHIIQFNALKSWTLLTPRPQIILFGNEPGADQVAAQLGLLYVPELARNPHGTPLLNDAFAQARQLAQHDILVYANADIIFFDDLVAATRRVQAAFAGPFLIIGQRVNFDQTERINFEDKDWPAHLRLKMAATGRLGAVVCKDYFVFTKPLFAQIPPFAVGRGNWDNWLVAEAHRQKIPVVDATPVLTAAHQNHTYAHLNGGGVASVVGPEARQNATAGGGMHLVYGSASSWQLTAGGLKRRRWPAALSFLVDLPRFLRLLQYLIFDSFFFSRR